MKRLIPVSIGYLCQIVLISVILTLATSYIIVDSSSSDHHTDIVLLIFVGALNLPNVDLPLQYGITRQSIFKYLVIISFISSLIYVAIISGLTSILNISVELATYPIELSVANMVSLILTFFIAILFMACFYYGQYVLHNLSTHIANFINIIVVLFTVIMVVLSVSVINTYQLSSSLISSILALLAVIELVLLYFLVKNVDITVAMRQYGKK